MNKCLLLFFVFSFNAVGSATTQQLELPQNGAVLIIQMIPEINTDVAVSHFQGGFRQAGYDPAFFVVDSNSDKRNGIKFDGKIQLEKSSAFEKARYPAENQRNSDKLKRIRNGIKKIAHLLEAEKQKISHIWIAGHGDSKGGYFISGELIFDSNADDLKSLFAPLKKSIAEDVKILMTSCSIFAGTKSDANARAILLHKTVGSTTSEIFGYTQIVSTTTINFLDSTNIFAVGVGTTIGATVLTGLIFPAKAALLISGLVCVIVNGYNYVAYDWTFFKQRRQANNPSEMGYLISVDKDGSATRKRGLGNDYFYKYYVSPHPKHPF